jgi:hypothetical protein
MRRPARAAIVIIAVLAIAVSAYGATKAQLRTAARMAVNTWTNGLPASAKALFHASCAGKRAKITCHVSGAIQGTTFKGTIIYKVSGGRIVEVRQIGTPVQGI